MSDLPTPRMNTAKALPDIVTQPTLSGQCHNSNLGDTAHLLLIITVTIIASRKSAPNGRKPHESRLSRRAEHLRTCTGNNDPDRDCALDMQKSPITARTQLNDNSFTRTLYETTTHEIVPRSARTNRPCPNHAQQLIPHCINEESRRMCSTSNSQVARSYLSRSDQSAAYDALPNQP